MIPKPPPVSKPVDSASEIETWKVYLGQLSDSEIRAFYEEAKASGCVMEAIFATLEAEKRGFCLSSVVS